ncbi:zinc-binding oxidoreductase-like protein ToxD [Mytilinidion resinicola]|uniref:Zinc-binding oxidoreductase-like protein ToxD n=1 Tax=Mytilinidion resinicola TaxID=574789 RepID=A0A6A6Z4P9_9PEZI|nr:zinc-binding oxidoreductase-like protein ToxD [Mytilinidion resinicola]KAF2815798.1 zinc-binding oxidoreductase-like protein ToxD [Mytilinidion resinicola]
MKDAIVHPGPTVEIIDSPIPEPGPDQLVIQVVVSGSNPKDWKMGDWTNTSANTGDDIAGIVHSVGENVYEFKPGDRVASFHEMHTPGGSYAEYALGWQHTTFHIPKKISFEEAATVPLAAMTAAIGLHIRLGLPEPWLATKEPIPLIVYGGSSAVGAFALKIASHANIHPLIVVAGGGSKYVETLIDRSKGDTIVDYRNGDDAVVSGIKEALKGSKVSYAFDAVSEKGSYVNITKVLDPHGAITLVLPGKEYPEIPKTVKQVLTSVGSAHKEDAGFAFIFFRYLARGFHEGWFTGHPTEVVPGGLGGVEQALKNLKAGKASAVKYVFRVAETEGVKSSL